MDIRYVDSLPLTEQLEIEERALNNIDFNVKREVSGEHPNEGGTIRGGRSGGSGGSGGVIFGRGWRQRMYDV